MKKIKYNLVFGLGGQLVTISLGILIPWLILNNFGSEINGLMSTVVQIFTYVALLEAGIGHATLNALYKPIANRDKEGISEVLSASQSYFRKVTRYYFICVIILTLVYPFLANTDIDKLTVGLVVLFQGLSSVLSFYFIVAFQQLLIANGKNYIISNINLIIFILTSLFKILLITKGADIVLVQFSFFVLSCLKVLIFILYCKKKYPWIVYKKKPNMRSLAQRKAFFIHEMSSVVFSSTDVVILSIFTSMKVASVYAVYNMVFIALNSIINIVNNGLGFILGQAYHQGRESYIKIHDTFESYYMGFVFALMTVAYILILPFVKLYTEGIDDANYIYEFLPVLFCIIQVLSASRSVSARLISIAGHARKTQGRSIIEAILNICISVILVSVIGIYGVLIGTVVALLYRMNDIILYANIKILNRIPVKVYSNILLNCFLFFSFVYIESLLDLNIPTYKEFILYAFTFTILLICIFFIAISILNYKEFKFLLAAFKNNITRKVKPVYDKS